MANLLPFNGLRFTQKAGEIKYLCCPPYDIISDEQRQNFLNVNEHNIIRLEKPMGENCYEDAGNTLINWEKDGILKQDENKSLYIYEEEFSLPNGEIKKIKGLVALVKIEEFDKKIVLPHEETLSKAKDDRLNLMKSTFCNFSQIYSLYMDDDKKIFSLIEASSKKEPVNEFKSDDGIMQRLWQIDDLNMIDAITKNFEEKQLFIADGHHRYETALNFRNYLRNEKGVKSPHSSDYVLMYLINLENDGLVVFPTHRLIKNLENFDEEKYLKGIEFFFNIEKRNDIENIEKNLSDNIDKNVFAFYTGNDYYYYFTLKDKNTLYELLPEQSKAYCDLDVSVLHSLILESVFGIDKKNMANQLNLTYTRDLSEAVNSVKNKEYQCSFILNPTKVSQIKDVALEGEKMPQKSTYFYPKLITGLVMNKICDKI